FEREEVGASASMSAASAFERVQRMSIDEPHRRTVLDEHVQAHARAGAELEHGTAGQVEVERAEQRLDLRARHRFQPAVEEVLARDAENGRPAHRVHDRSRRRPGQESRVSSAIRNNGLRFTSSYMRPTYWPRMPRKTSCAPPSTSTAAVTEVQPCTVRPATFSTRT